LDFRPPKRYGTPHIPAGIRIIRSFHKFPTPEFPASLIDNPLRHGIQPPAEINPISTRN
jgi:hypothetical protein